MKRSLSRKFSRQKALFIDGNHYYVSWIAGTLSRWDGKRAVVLNNASACGHDGLILTKEKTFLLAFTEPKGMFLELDKAGHESKRWATDNRIANVK